MTDSICFQQKNKRTKELTGHTEKTPIKNQATW